MPVSKKKELIFFLERFLRARKFDVAKAKEMLLSAEQWRKEFKVVDIVEYVPPFFSFPFKKRFISRHFLFPDLSSFQKKNKSTNIILNTTIKPM